MGQARNIDRATPDPHDAADIPNGRNRSDLGHQIFKSELFHHAVPAG
jgi:hypothetical protein